MLSIDDKDRIRILTAVATRGARYQLTRIAVITFSNLVLLAVPLSGLVRLDLWGGHHLLLGEPAEGLDALKGVIIAIAALWGTTFLSNMIVGRFFCGWGCPVGYVSRLGEDAQIKHRPGRTLRWLGSHLAGAGFVGTFIAAVMLWWVDWRVMLDGTPLAKGVVLGTWLLLCVGGYLHGFMWRFGFCKTVCPIGLYYRFVTSSTPIGIRFSNEPSPCIECGACEKICPVDLDPKNLGQAVAGDTPSDGVDDEPMRYGDAECIRCGDCVEACAMIFKGHPGETPPLRFGKVERAD